MTNSTKIFALIIIGFIVLSMSVCVNPTDTDDLIKVVTPKANPPSGAVAVDTPVTLSTTTSGAEIWFTINGNTPAKNTGTKYSSPISITAAVTIKAIAVKDAMIDSGILTVSYTVTSAPSVIIAGSYASGSGTRTCYWQDGIKTDLSTSDSKAVAIFTDGNDIYIEGYSGNTVC